MEDLIVFFTSVACLLLLHLGGSGEKEAEKTENQMEQIVDFK